MSKPQLFNAEQENRITFTADELWKIKEPQLIEMFRRNPRLAEKCARVLVEIATKRKETR